MPSYILFLDEGGVENKMKKAEQSAFVYTCFDRLVEGGKVSRYLRVCLNRLSRLFR